MNESYQHSDLRWIYTRFRRYDSSHTSPLEKDLEAVSRPQCYSSNRLDRLVGNER